MHNLNESCPSLKQSSHHLKHLEDSRLEHQQNNTFYRRELPPQLHSFTSDIGKRLFKESLNKGTAEIYFSLSGNFTMQSEPAFCGLGSLVMVLNALSVDPGKRWKGVWRWYSDEMLDCTPPLEQVKHNGLTFHELVCLARCNGLSVVPKRADKVSLNEFLSDVKRICQSQNEYLVVSFSRGALNQTGDGHFSPIGAFHEKENQILVMDTARFKYPSYFVDAVQLYQAMLPLDSQTKLPRGYLLLSKGNMGMSLVKVKKESWNSFHSLIYTCNRSLASKKDVLTYLLSSSFNENGLLLYFEKPGLDLAGKGLSTEHSNEISKLLEQIHLHPMYLLVQEFLHHHPQLLQHPRWVYNGPDQIALMTLFLLSLPDSIYIQCSHTHSQFFLDLKNTTNPSLLEMEMNRLTEQFDNILNVHCKCGKIKM